MNGGHNRTQSGPGGGSRSGGQPPRQNQALQEYEQLIKIRRFTDDELMKLSDKLGESLADDPDARREGKEITNTQIRKFYNLVQVAKVVDSPEVLKVKLRTLQAQVTYAAARKTITPSFKQFFDLSLNKVIASAELKNALKEFATFFEALYAYFYYYTEKRRGR